MRTFRRWLVLLAIISLIAAACGGSDDDAASDGDGPDDDTEQTTDSNGDDGATDDGDSGSDDDADSGDSGEDTDDAGDGGGDVELTATARGVTADTITIGYAYLDFEILVDLGLSAAGYGQQDLAFQSIVDDVNANGGINGRQVEVIYEAYSPLGTQDAEAVCLRLTEDNEVFAVLGGFLGPAEPANTCIAGRQETVLVGGVQTDERLGEARAPWVTDRPTRARVAEVLMQLLGTQGLLDGKKVAVVTNTDAADAREGVVQSVSDAGAEIAEDLVLEAPIGDVIAEDQAWATLAERIRGSDANAVLLVGNPSSGIRNIGSQGLDVDIWVIDQESLLNLGTTVDLELARGALAAAPLTGQDLWDHESVAECREIFSAANPDVEITGPADLEEGQEDWPAGLTLGCRFFRLFQTIAEAAGPDLTNESFGAAAAGLSQFAVPGQPFASLGPDKFDSNDSFRLVEFNPDIGANGALDELTGIEDVTP